MDQVTRRKWLTRGLAGITGTVALTGVYRTLGEPHTRAWDHKRNHLRGVKRVQTHKERHWVGDGFHVTTLFSPHIVDPNLTSPFILLDYAWPKHFSPNTKQLGVGAHPHRGFETVTFALDGEVAHKDSFGGGGTIRPGDVQWMTAGSGVVHEEMHSEDFSKTGGRFEMVQLWVNLPSRHKMTAPRYQAVKGRDFRVVELEQGEARLIAGELANVSGPAQTHSKMHILDITLANGDTTRFEPSPGHNTLVLATGGNVKLQNRIPLAPGELAVFDPTAPGIVKAQAKADARLLVLSGEPLNEPVVAHGPFVMNTREQIAQAIRDYRAGTMGTLPPRS